MSIALQEILSSGYFRYGAVPFISALLIVFVKRESRNTPLVLEDFAIGVELMVTAIVMHLVLVMDSARRLASLSRGAIGPDQPTTNAQPLPNAEYLDGLLNSILLLFSMMVGLWAIASLVRYYGWDSEGKIRPFVGLVVPMGMGGLFLFAVLWSSAR
jgi:hypothetical protein